MAQGISEKLAKKKKEKERKKKEKKKSIRTCGVRFLSTSQLLVLLELSVLHVVPSVTRMQTELKIKSFLGIMICRNTFITSYLTQCQN